FIHKNIDYIAHSDLGFNRKNLLGVETSEKLAQHRDDVRSLLLQNPDIIDVAWARSEFIALNRHNVGVVSPDLPGVEIMFDVIFTDDHFLQFMGIDIVEGRDFMPSDLKSESGAYIFNETARHQYNLTTETRLPRIGGDYSRYSDIVGICKDFKFKPLNYELSPVAFCIPGKDTPDYAVLKQLYVRLADNADVKKSMDHISNSLAQIDPDFAYMNHPVRTFQNEMMSSNYTKEETLTQLITLFAMIAILISVMGIFGIVYFEMERRRKEIGIRKVNGAMVWEILLIFNRKYLIITAICSVFAIAISYILVNMYFSGFAYHYPINPWIFILGVLIAMAITALVVTAASFKAANENPVNTLANE
ncbi:MAG: FtsX-like permease family protein, partial [Bacteroidales bacterium]|nr:FtsX-like permease family protein [Bacteroidales bacterium]